MPDAEQDGHPYYGGQAVLEGVMMRGARQWAVAVRRPSGQIYLERQPVNDFPERHPLFKKPMLRGTYGLVDALSIGTRALTVAANQAVSEEEQLTGKQMAGSLGAALLLFVGLFIVVPNLGLAFAHSAIGSEVGYHLLEGVVRVGIFLGYLWAISLMADIKRVFAYHGAEHKTIAAWEHGEVLEPATIDKYSTLHVRCGTNFLFMTLLLAIVVYSLTGLVWATPDTNVVGKMAYHIGLRLALLPVIAGLAYEGLRLGAGHDHPLVRAMMKPGLWLQRITTKPPTHDQIEVAVRAFEAVVPHRQLEGRVSQALDSEVVWGPDVSGATTQGPGGGQAPSAGG